MKSAALTTLLERRKPGWLARARGTDLDLRFASAARDLGKGPLALTDDERAMLADAGIDWPLERWGVDELGRVSLLLDAALLDAGAERVEQAFFRGDNRERQAVLKALPFLRDPQSFVPLAVEACRTNVRDVFEAIACDNPLPARCFAEPSFNQLVLKAVFVGAPVDRIVGLEGRLTPELARMADDYASERRAAGRSIPPDLEALRRPKHDDERDAR